MQSARVLKSNVTKTLLKGTIGLAIFSLFLEASPSNFVNYVIFLGISYAILLLHMAFKGPWSTELMILGFPQGGRSEGKYT